MSGALPCLIAARAYRQRRWFPIPVPLGTKKPTHEGWPDLRLTGQEIEHHFAKPTNVGVLLGTPSAHLVDLDIDVTGALDLVERFLPSTWRVFGRESKPSSHRLYTTAREAKTAKYADPTTGEMLIELRSTGCQTVFPPSRHPSGEEITWEQRGDEATVSVDDLSVACGWFAAAVLVRRHLAGQEAELLAHPPRDLGCRARQN